MASIRPMLGAIAWCEAPGAVKRGRDRSKVRASTN
jgi:hypothetical protein